MFHIIIEIFPIVKQKQKGRLPERYRESPERERKTDSDGFTDHETKTTKFRVRCDYNTADGGLQRGNYHEGFEYLGVCRMDA